MDAPGLDGTPDEAAWKTGAVFSLSRGDDIYAECRMLRCGRDLYVSIRSNIPPFAVGLRMVFADPESKARVLALVSPLNPPLPPLALFREFGEGKTQPRDAGRCDVRFRFEKDETYSAEVRLALDDIEITRTPKHYLFSMQLWDLGSNRAIAAYPIAAQGPMIKPQMADLGPATDWGAGDAAPSAPQPVNEALRLLDALLRDAPTEEGAPATPAITPYAGTRDGRRKDAPLAEMEERLLPLLERYPDYASLRAQLMRTRLGRSDIEGAMKVAQGLLADYPSLAMNYRQTVVTAQLLRDLGRYDDALSLFQEHAPMVKMAPEVAAQKAGVVALASAWKLEQSLREKEAARDDLPRVRFKTSKGEIVLELYEDDAPNVVAHFLTLVESRAYDGTRFHWVEGSGRVAGGDPNSRDEDPFNDGYGGVDRMVESEPGRRLNFPYTIAMVDKRRTRRTEGSVFAFNIVPAPTMDGLNTVIGCVVTGQDVLRRLEYYDTLQEATVLRKRPHPYTPVYR